MSYILEALRKAEAERERGLVPGLHARSSAAPDVAEAPGTARLRTWAPWAVAGVSLLVAAGLAWTWRAAGPAEQPSVMPVATTPPTVQAAVPGTTSPPPAAIGVVAAPGPSYAPLGVAAPVSTVPVTGGATMPPTTRSPAVTARDSGPALTGVASVPASAPLQANTEAATPPADHRVYTLAELPEATRRELPALSIAGASYSEHPANRLLIVNGNVFHEGDRLTPDLVLERIDLKSAVLHYKDVRFAVTY